MITITDFHYWYNNEFKTDTLYRCMEFETEDSPWHRERTVACHVDMVVGEYLINTSEWSKESVLAGFAAAFHDVGKPVCVQHKWKEERGDYKAYGGHELVSARLWEDWAVENWTMLKERFEFEPYDIYRVGYMIEFHLPWGIKKRDKVKALSLTLLMNNDAIKFPELLKADTFGRISDDAETKRMNTIIWCDEFRNNTLSLGGHSILYETNNPKNKPVLITPIACSGSGKSTARFKQDTPVHNIFSLDTMRLELYGEPYDNAFFQSTKDKHFRSTCNERYRELLRENKNLYLDNINISRKNRRFYLTEARNRGYFLLAALFPVALQTVRDRQDSRPDKTVPDDVVKQQYMKLQLPQYGEFDNVVVLDSNL